MTRRPDESTDAYHARLCATLLADVSKALDATWADWVRGYAPTTTAPDQIQAVSDTLGFERSAKILEARASKLARMGGNLLMYGEGHAASDLVAAKALRSAASIIEALAARPVLLVETPAEDATRITIDLRVDGDSLRVQAIAGADPAETLDRAMAALKAERDALYDCPMHQPVETPAEGLRGDTGRFGSYTNEALAGQCRMQARESLDPDLEAFMYAVAARLTLAPMSGNPATEEEWQDRHGLSRDETASAPLSGRDGSLREALEWDACYGYPGRCKTPFGWAIIVLQGGATEYKLEVPWEVDEDFYGTVAECKAQLVKDLATRSRAALAAVPPDKAEMEKLRQHGSLLEGQLECLHVDFAAMKLRAEAAEARAKHAAGAVKMLDRIMKAWEAGRDGDNVLAALGEEIDAIVSADHLATRGRSLEKPSAPEVSS